MRSAEGVPHATRARGPLAGGAVAVLVVLLASLVPSAGAQGTGGWGPGAGKRKHVAALESWGPVRPSDPVGGAGVVVVDFPEGSALRVVSLADVFGAAASSGWVVGGPDGALFEVDAGALRFAVMARGLDRYRLVPDFEAPVDADGDGRYEVTVAPAGAGVARGVVVQVTDRDEPGRVSLSGARPVRGVALSASLVDPDGPLGRVVWRWERSVGPGVFVPIEGAVSAVYTPTAADTGRLLRAVARYADRHGATDTDAAAAAAAAADDGAGTAAAAAGADASDAEQPSKSVWAVSGGVVLGPRLVALSASSEGFAGSGLHPVFDPAVTDYAVPCADSDVLTVEWAAPVGVRVDVGGVQPQPGRSAGAARAVGDMSDVVVTVADGDGAVTRYTVHCVPEALSRVATSGSSSEALWAAVVGGWAAVVDDNGVPRVHRPTGGGGFLFRTFGSGPARRWAYRRAGDAGDADGASVSGWSVLDAGFEPVRTVATVAPLETTGRHDVRLLGDGAALLMAFEPAVRDFSFLSDARRAAVRFDDPDGNRWGDAVETRDSAVQIVDADGSARWTWNSWGRVPLEDCVQHRFPDGWAHLNSAEMTPAGRVVVSLRGCSSVLLLDPTAPAGEEIVWRIGQTNLSAAQFAARGLGPAPWPLVGDPQGAFCGQHAATLPGGGVEPRLVLFDNGVHCVTDPSAGEPLTRVGGEFSRVVEYALDDAHGEAVFVRERSHGGRRAVLGQARGHIEVQPDEAWLISWGRPGQPEDAAPDGPPNATATLIDPDSGGEPRFAVLRGEQDLELTALAVPRAALTQAPPPLGAAFPDGAAADGDSDGSLRWVAVAFTRPVARFAADTPSVRVDGGALTAAKPLQAFGKPAHAWLLGLRPHNHTDANTSMTVRLIAGRACADGGICTADGTTLQHTPAPLTLAAGDGPAQRQN